MGNAVSIHGFHNKWLKLLQFSIFCRKIEIVQFASKTRQQFVRLLALVKWAASAERVDKCQVS